MIAHEKHDGAGQHQWTDRSESPQDASSGRGAGDPPRPDPLGPLLKNLAELREYLSFYIAARADRLRVRVRQIVLLAIIGLVAALVASAALVTAAVLFVDGIANGLAVLLGGRLWAGELLAGFGVVALFLLTLYAMAKGVTKSSRRRTIDKYEHRRQEQRAQFGHDVSQRAQR